MQAIVHPTLSEDEAHTVAFVKNVVRRNLSSIDQAHAIYQARRRGKTVEAIPKELGRSEKQVHRYEEMLRFPPKIQRLLEDHMVIDSCINNGTLGGQMEVTHVETEG